MSIYIDERTIKIGDLAFELGDYLFAKSQYKKALASIQNDDNHESEVASYTKSISEKMEQINGSYIIIKEDSDSIIILPVKKNLV